MLRGGIFVDAIRTVDPSVHCRMQGLYLSRLIVRAELHIDMCEPEIVEWFANRFESEASIERDKTHLRGQDHKLSRVMFAAV